MTGTMESQGERATLLRFPLRMTKLPFALSLSKDLSEWARAASAGRTGFDKAQPERQ